MPMPASTNTDGVDETPPRARRVRSLEHVDRDPDEHHRHQRVDDVRLHLVGEVDEQRRQRGERDTERGVAHVEQTPRKHPEREEQQTAGEQGEGAERELVNATDHDGEPLEPEKAHGRGLRVVEWTREAEEGAADDVERHPDLVEPERAAIEVEVQPQDDTHGEQDERHQHGAARLGERRPERARRRWRVHRGGRRSCWRFDGRHGDESPYRRRTSDAAGASSSH